MAFRAAMAFAVALGLLPASGTPSRAAGPPSTPPVQAASAAAAAEAPAGPETTRSGALLLKTSDGYVEAPRLGTDVQITVSGPTLRARLTQAFTNPTDHWIEAVYVYPLAEDGAVDSLKMVVGDRIVVGEIRKREDARQIYETARAEGRRASLVEQERPNLFTNSVANIGPGETVLVQIEYQEPVRLDGGVWSVRVPLVVAPRYSPKAGVPDQARLAAPAVDPRGRPAINPVSISVRLRPGFELGAVSSDNHPVRVTREGTDGARVDLADGEVPADRDFVLSWRRKAADAPAAALFRERVGKDDYVLAVVTPPVSTRARPQPPREVVFVIDNSGSMGGESMQQAKASLLYALSRLKPGDRFNVVRFDDTFDVLFPDAVEADAAHLDRARRFVGGLEASGGTEMLPAMQAALDDRRPEDRSRLRQVVFLTDGAIGNEQALLDEIAARRGRSRVFMVGIGSAPNSYLMTRASELGRGTFTHIGSVQEVDARMRALFDKLESPIATNLAAVFTAGEADATPALLPDLYAGEPVVLAARVTALKGSLKLTGQIDGRAWSADLPVASAVPGEGVSKVWARHKVDDAQTERTLGRITDEEADARIEALGLAHHLVTARTSLVAVDRTPARPQGRGLTRSELPLNLPHGWDFDRLFGPTAHGSNRPADSNAGQSEATLELPQTATDTGLMLLGGLLFGASGLLLLAFGRRRYAEEPA